MSLTERDLDLIEVALESAISATGSGLLRSDAHGMSTLNGEYKHALAGTRKMRKAKPLTLTEKERDELRALLMMVLDNSDQWELMDLRALRRIAGKVDP